ncbi:hypothetical protein [Aliamphritea hakodatensis]|uniref:hypothetical protein n=1 Tax=Aliamphritea hakodatensis TaxID=2895352 RepID=UPI0022FD8E66|nr:hypothetical protein [Aliamphritea hakodatensis]
MNTHSAVVQTASQNPYQLPPVKKVVNSSNMASFQALSEVDELKANGLIGRESMTVGSFRQNADGELYGVTGVMFWSEKDHSQWQAYRAEGSAAGDQAAEYQQQMVTERQQLASQYLGSFLNLQKQFRQVDLPEGSPAISAEQVLDNIKEGKPAAQMPDGSLHPDSDVIDSFVSAHQPQINTMTESYQALESFPKEVEGWLSSQDIQPADDVNQVIDKLKNAYAAGPAERGSEYRPVTVGFGDTGTGTVEQLEREDVTQYKPELGESIRLIMDDSARSWEDLDGLDQIAAREMFSDQRASLYQQMQTLTNHMFSEFSGRFSLTSGTGGFSLQDMVDNHLAGRSLGTLDNGTLHPEAEQIEQYWQDNRLVLEQYSARQQQLNELPETANEYLQQNPLLVRNYLLDHYERLLAPAGSQNG